MPDAAYHALIGGRARAGAAGIAAQKKAAHPNWGERPFRILKFKRSAEYFAQLHGDGHIAIDLQLALHKGHLGIHVTGCDLLKIVF